MTTYTYYKKGSRGQTRIWSVSRNKDVINITYGQQDGKMTKAIEYGIEKNIGKSNYITKEEDAQNKLERLILAKAREGYKEKLQDEEEVTIDNLPQSLSFYKPLNSINAYLTKLIDKGDAIFTRKRDGEMMIIVITDTVEIYSRKMLPTHHNEVDRAVWADRFPHIVDEVKQIFPKGTILLGEMVGSILDDKRWYAAKVLKSLTPDALSLQDENDPLHYIIWDMAMVSDKWLNDWSWQKRRDSLENLMEDYNALETRAGDEDIPSCEEGWSVSLVETAVFDDIEKSIQDAIVNEYEGWVVLDPSTPYGKKFFNTRGKPERPKFCAKIKPVFEDDFVADWDPANGVGTYGKGKNTGKLGSVALYQYNGKGTLVYICLMGNGWSQTFIDKNSCNSKWPKTLNIKYDARQYKRLGAKTNALTFPRLVAERKDKGANECLNPEL